MIGKITHVVEEGVRLPKGDQVIAEDMAAREPALRHLLKQVGHNA